MTMSLDNDERKQVDATTASEKTAQLRSVMAQMSGVSGGVRSLTPTSLLETAALVLFGRHAIPVRLKILLDRLLASVSDDQLLQILTALGWSRHEYTQGYLKNAEWTKCSSDEEPLILRHFLNFEQTRHIAAEFIQRDEREGRQPLQNSDMRGFVDHMQSMLRLENFPLAAVLPMLPMNTLDRDHFRNTLNVSQGLKSSSYVSQQGGLTNEHPVRLPSSVSPAEAIDLLRLKPMPLNASTCVDGSLDLSRSTSAVNINSPTSVAPRELVPAASPRFAHSPDPPSEVSPASHDKPGQSTPIIAPVSAIQADSALNLTVSSTSDSNLVSTPPAVTSKPVAAVKRKAQWDPVCSNSTSLVNPVTGKKRVQCHACMKTFCDKGALKIHFSAVHLKEMHKCSVEGCTMMFSSRRSRNRHSANPNPKLHTPHMRRKISPHDGRMAQPHPPVGLPPTLNSNFSHQTLLSGLSNVPGFPLLTNPDVQKHALESLHSSFNFNRGSMGLNSIPEDLQMNKSFAHYQQSLMTGNSYSNVENDNSFRSESNDGSTYGCGMNNEDDSSSMDNQNIQEDMTHGDHESIAIKNKRKSQHPTKFSVRLDDDDIHMSSDDSSLDEVADEDYDKEDEDLELKNMKSDVDSGDEENLTSENSDLTAREGDAKGGSDDTKSADDAITKSENTSQHVQPNHLVNDSKSHYPLKYLEKFSKYSDFLGNGLMGSTTGLELPMRIDDLKGEQESGCDDNGNTDNKCTSDDAHSVTDSTFSISPSESPNPTDERIMNGNVPINRKNPRSCVACGKVFQNLLTVKTHYQNVHMKMMHNCIVDGCKATFPSKRSRDRHSSNYNLHRKLLSTSNDQPSTGRVDSATPLEASWNAAYVSQMCSNPIASNAFHPFGLTASINNFCENQHLLPAHPSLLPALMHPVLGAAISSGLIGPRPEYRSRSPSPKNTSTTAIPSSETLTNVV